MKPIINKTSLRRIKPLTEAERHQILAEWNDWGMPAHSTATDYPRDKCIHQLFEQQVERTPDAVAVLFGDQQLTYRELNTRANQLAHYLQSLGVGPEVLVGICVERSIEMIVGLLGILKAGGAYVPLDPAYPAERLTYMLQDCGAPVLLTQDHLANVVPQASPPRLGGMRGGRQVLCLDREWEVICQENGQNPVTDVHPNNLAYVIYTSGSTGKPKGVLVPHIAINRLVKNTDYIDITPQNRMAQASNASFDAATFEIWGALANGARLVGISRELSLSPQKLVTELREQQITILFLTTALFNQVVTLAPNAFDSVRYLLFGGEAVDPVAVRKLLEYGPPAHFLHVYGPTENTTFSSWYAIQSVAEDATTVPIGKPIANSQIYILDAQLDPVPIGVVGELYVGGDGLALGYLNRPQLTEERFIPNPFAPEERPSKLYKTGDLARWLPSGDVEFVGRIDDQVKIRGFRIELGEIKAILSQHSDVQQAVVIAREDTPGNKRLVAYIIPEGGNETLSSTALRDFLKEKLPEYMIPAAFVQLSALPLTPNGKVDHRALPIPDRTRPDLVDPFVMPRSHTEQMLADIWGEVLGFEQIGVLDDFFNLGGHSLMATQIISRLRQLFQVQLPLAHIFEYPTIADLAQLIEQHKDDAAVPQMPLQRIKPILRDGELPVSFAQERVYFIQQLAPASSAYQFQATLRFTGQLDVAVLEQSLSEMVRRHEIFRTTFPALDGRLVQVIHPAQPVSLPLIDLENVPAKACPDEGRVNVDAEAEIQRLIEAEINKPFDLNQLPLVRWALLRLNQQEHLLIHVEHHMVHDGWSLNLFLRELLELYQAFSQGKPSPLSEPPIQFVDYAHWQRQWVHSEEAEAQLAYWVQKLAGSSPLLELPYDRARPAEQTYQGASIRMELPLDLCDSLRVMSRQEGVTLFTTMLAAFLTQLHRYSGQEDLNVGSAVANRRLRETEGLIGMIVNNIILRTDLSGNPTFGELLTQVRQVTLEAYANEDLPFDKVVEALKPERNLSYNPLFQVMFSFHDSALPELKLPGLKLELHEAISNKSAKFDLDVVVIPRSEQRVGHRSGEEGIEAEGITLIWEYNSDLFDEATIERMMGNYQTLLEAIVGNTQVAETRISALPLLTDAEQEQILVAWNATQTAYARDQRCLHHLFEEHAAAARTPDAVAVVFPASVQLTYRELNAKANQLAHYLIELGVGRDVLVAISVERSPMMVVGLLAILKAGGAYVPLDPTYPAERLRYMLHDCGASVLLTQKKFSTLLPEDSIHRVELDAQWEEIALRSTNNPVRDVQATDLAYCIYTSGSTGKPKGVLIEHHSIVNFTHAAIQEYEISASDRVLQFASLSFDTAAEEIYPCLSSGGTLILRNEQMLESVEAFVEASQALKLTVWDLPTAYWHLITSELSSGHIVLPDALRLVIIGGERALPERVKQWNESIARSGGTTPQLLNTYGPTEATVVATTYPLSGVSLLPPQSWGGQRGGGREVPIGRPIGNVEVYVLDQYRQPVPIGVPGELYIGGAGVARGYLNRPALTQERFVTNPFLSILIQRCPLSILIQRSRTNPSSTSGLLYKTGDLVRYILSFDADLGTLEFLGRIDRQVKVRGLRIELGEIETVLTQHAGVQEAVVMAREDTPGSKRLVAYIVPKPQAPAAEDELRRFLKEKLPAYMVPSAFVMLDALPMTPSGKIDRRALPLPHSSALPNIEHGLIERATNPIEEQLVAIWADVLGLERLSIHDNFFELGGDSIISIQLVSRAGREGLKFTPKQLFQYQTIAELAAVVQKEERFDGSIQAKQDIVMGAVPLTPIQHWFFEQNMPESHYFNQSVMLEVPHDIQPELVEQAVQHLLSHHDALRLRFVRDGNQWQQINAAPQEQADVPFTIVDLSELSSEEQERAIEATDREYQASLNLSEGPIVRVALFKLGLNQPARLLFIVHHLAVDGISWRILLEDLATAYQQISRGQPVQLPSKTTSWQDWANRLIEYAQSDTLAAEIDSWLPEAGLHIAPLPVDYAPDTNQEANTLSSTATVTRHLSVEETRALLSEVPAAYNTQINDVLLTALVQSLAPWTGANSLLVDLEGHGREELPLQGGGYDLSRTVGWFTTLFPVYLKVEALNHPGEALKSVKEQLRRIPKRGIGYGVLRYLTKNANLSGQDATIRQKLEALPQAEVSFNYLGQFDNVLSAGAGLGTTKEWKSEHSQQGNRSHLLAVAGWIRAGKLEMQWSYSQNLHQPATIERLASEFMAALSALIAHCQAPNTGGYTPSDFSARQLSQKRLDKLMNRIKRKKKRR